MTTGEGIGAGDNPDSKVLPNITAIYRERLQQLRHEEWATHQVDSAGTEASSASTLAPNDSTPEKAD